MATRSNSRCRGQPRQCKMGMNMDSLKEAQLTTQLNHPKILFIDAYDSFSNNITSLLATLLNVQVLVLPIDAQISNHDFCRELRHYDAVVCGPGPGSPDRPSDVGLMTWVWDLADDQMLPVLGVCLGFQGLVLACGGKLRRLSRGLHGMVRPIVHHRHSCPIDELQRDNIFAGVGDFKATLYHSLCAYVSQDTMRNWRAGKRINTPLLPNLVPLAWVEEDRADGQGTECILTAIKHMHKPFWALQYHPESVCTEQEGHLVVRNWFQRAVRWNHETRRVIINSDGTDLLARPAVRPSLLEQVVHMTAHRQTGETVWEALLCPQRERLAYKSLTLDLPNCSLETTDILEILQAEHTDHIILDSANGNQPAPRVGVDVRGRFSIIALRVDECLRIQHHAEDNFVNLIFPRHSQSKVSLRPGENVWHMLAKFHDARRASLDSHAACLPREQDVPFLGGFVGFVTYEQGLSNIGITLASHLCHQRPDVCLAWVTKSLVVDHQRGVLHVQDLQGNTDRLASVAAQLRSSGLWKYGCHSAPAPDELVRPPATVQSLVQKPEPAKYEAKVLMCQEYIAAGDSYELCLTDQTHITRRMKLKMNHRPEQPLPPPASPSASPTLFAKSQQVSSGSWALYRKLRRRNPAPFASYVCLGGATLISSSPERFLHYDRSGLCSMKPMKGTVRKSSEPGDDCATNLKEAEAILHAPKEEAENLMIVDLVRHDLHGICGAGQVSVPELLKVEEYQTVYQMTTVVEGQLFRAEKCNKDNSPTPYSGLDVLSASLPPGSMTGAPKKRSCEILQQIEDGKERSIYSGVVGYMCISGRGDWSVTIRSMFRWDDECKGPDEEGEATEIWHIGAGGAVTILSTPEGERAEMLVKLARTLSIFADTD